MLQTIFQLQRRGSFKLDRWEREECGLTCPIKKEMMLTFTRICSFVFFPKHTNHIEYLDSCIMYLFFYLQPSPIKKERSPRPQSFCHSSSISPQDKLTHPAFSTPRDKQRLSYGAFTNQIFASASTDSPTSPTADAPPLPPRNAGKGKSAFKLHWQAVVFHHCPSSNLVLQCSKM